MYGIKYNIKNRLKKYKFLVCVARYLHERKTETETKRKRKRKRKAKIDFLMSDKKNVKKQVLDFISIIRNSFISVDMIRIGSNNDGGYLVPKDLKKVKYCFSPGVSFNADFELQLANDYKIKSFMADASVENSPIKHEKLSFEKKFLGAFTEGDVVTLSDWLKSKKSEVGNDNNMILQMDIEGAEIDVLLETPESTLSRFAIMVIEFHDMELIFNKSFNRTFSFIFKKLCKTFSIVHIHPNNYSKSFSYKDVSVPSVFEVTFVRKDWTNDIKNNNKITLPHHLDENNCLDGKDLILPEVWYKK